MAIVEYHGALYTPYIPPFGSSEPAYLSAFMDASTERIATILTIPKDGTIESFEFLALVSVAVSNISIKYSLQDLDANGKPDGTADQYRNASLSDGPPVWTSTGILSDDGTDTGVKRTVTRNQRIACVIEFTSFAALDALEVKYIASSQSSPPNAVWEYNTGTWQVIDTSIPVIALKYDDGTYAYLAGCIPAASMSIVNSWDTTPSQEMGMAVSLPMPVRVGGISVHTLAELSSAGTIVDLVLYGVDPYEPIDVVEVGFTLVNRNYTILFSENWLFEANVVYRITFRPRSDSQNIQLYNYTVNSADLLDTVEGGTSFYYTKRIGSGSWEDTLTERSWMALLVTGLDHDISGGGGGTGWDGTP